MDDTPEVVELTTTQEFTIPDSLKETSNIPEGYVPVYFYEEKKNLKQLGSFGFQREQNYMDEAKPEIEDIFDEIRQEKGIEVDRGECLFAFPDHPDKLYGEFSFRPADQVMLMAWVDPKKVLVTDGSAYTEADRDLDYNNPDSARRWAETYWKNAVTLQEVIDDPSKLEDNTMPEALVPGPIPTNYIKVVENPIGNEEE